MTKESLEDYANELFKETQVLKKQLQQCKSIVKVVDPDNLPERRIFIIFDDQLTSGCFTHQTTFTTDDGYLLSDQQTVEITHYIETKDIIKMMGDL